MEAVILALALGTSLLSQEPIDIASRWELSVDDHLVAQRQGLTCSCMSPSSARSS